MSLKKVNRRHARHARILARLACRRNATGGTVPRGTRAARSAMLLQAAVREYAAAQPGAVPYVLHLIVQTIADGPGAPPMGWSDTPNNVRTKMARRRGYLSAARECLEMLAIMAGE